MGYDLSNKISEAAKSNQVIPSVLSGVDVTLTRSVGNRLGLLSSVDRAKLISNLRKILANPTSNTWNSLTSGINTLPTVSEGSNTRLTNSDVVNSIQSLLRTSNSVNSQVNSTQVQPFIFSLKNLNATYPGPAKFYETNITSQRWVFPVPPDSFNVSSPSSPNIISTISGNTYTHAGNIELDEISFSGFFPFFLPTLVTGFGTGVTTGNWPMYIPDYMKTSTAEFAKYYSPGEWVSNLVTAQRANQPLEFCVYAPTSQNESFAASSENDLVIYPIPVTVIAFDWKMGSIGGDRRDVEFNITLKRWKEQRMRLDSTTASIRREPAQARTYITKKTNGVHDTLLSISQSKFPKTKMWNQIYKLNKIYVDAWFQTHRKRNPGSNKTRYNFPLPVGKKLKLPRVS